VGNFLNTEYANILAKFQKTSRTPPLSVQMELDDFVSKNLKK